MSDDAIVIRCLIQETSTYISPVSPPLYTVKVKQILDDEVRIADEITLTMTDPEIALRFPAGSIITLQVTP